MTTRRNDSNMKRGTFMTHRMVRGITATLGACVLLAGTAAQVSADETPQAADLSADRAATPAAYINYLSHSDEEGAAETLRGFKSLTLGEQKKFIEHLHDPALLKSYLDAATEQSAALPANTTGTTTTLRNGDVTIRQERAVSTFAAAAAKPLPKGNHTVKYNTDLKLFGVKVIKLSLWVNFYSNGKDITKVNYADAGKMNFSGIINISKGVPKTSLSEWGFCKRGKPCNKGHNADASVVWEGSIVIKGSTVQVDKRQWMRANVYGSLINYSLKNV
ncbi:MULTISPECIES: hypothetical protein [Streptomyces]|uniref:hypothetical protein n=1 Tax=Streptomyces TaxID=1883 RepID=UPI001E48FC00|nr:hypothetical protein [Streptomyces sp. DH1]